MCTNCPSLLNKACWLIYCLREFCMLILCECVCVCNQAGLQYSEPLFITGIRSTPTGNRLSPVQVWFNFSDFQQNSNVENLPPHVLRLVYKEVSALAADPPEGIKVYPSDEDITELHTAIEGPGKSTQDSSTLLQYLRLICYLQETKTWEKVSSEQTLYSSQG